MKRPTGLEGYAVASLLFDTLDWPKEHRRDAMEEVYRRWRSIPRTPTTDSKNESPETPPNPDPDPA